jgi:hypothetical protein
MRNPLIINGGTLWATIQEAIESADLEGHLAVLVLSTGFRAPPGVSLTSPWSSAVQSVLARDLGHLEPSRRIRDIALVGARLALDSAPVEMDFEAAARKELLREPMPPAARIYDDERLLLGVAAGIGVAAPQLAELLCKRLSDRTRHVTMRQYCIDLWAEALAKRLPKFNESMARRALQEFSSTGRTAALSDEDLIAMFWLAARLLDAPWSPDDSELARLYEFIWRGSRTLQAWLLRNRPFDALDAAFVLEAITISPATRLERRSICDQVLKLVDFFNASASVVAKRQRGRPGIAITDEYDVQDLFHAFVIPIIPDVVPEDPTAKVAGRSSRLDFVSKEARLGFELKHVKSATSVTKIREEILIDERTYQEHPYIDTVIVFVADPESHIPLHERNAFERDLSQQVAVGGRTVQYIARIR